MICFIPFLAHQTQSCNYHSNFNEFVDIAAPGVDILSSIPRIGLEPVGNISSIGTVGNATVVNVTGIKFEYARYINHPGVTGTLVDCGLGREVCPGPGPVGGGGGHICFIQRGYVSVAGTTRSLSCFCSSLAACSTCLLENHPLEKFPLLTRPSIVNEVVQSPPSL
jgi:subtilisin family serine protease